MSACKHIFGLLCLVFIAFLAVTPAKAMLKPTSFHLAPTVGGYLFEGNQDIEHGPAYGLRFGASFSEHWQEELSLFFIDTESDDGAGDIDGYLYRLEGLYTFLPDKRISPFTAAGIGGITLDPDRGDSDTRFLVNYGGGLKLGLTDSLSLRGDVRHLVSFNDVQSNLLYSLGLTWSFGKPRTVQARTAPADSDGDGVPDTNDRCPGTPSGVSVGTDGCPRDSDNDGVPDYQDRCPDTEAGLSVDSRGCPRDSDADGVADHRDDCPDTSRQAEVDSRGCPIDSDADGVADHRDECPNTPQQAKVDSKGCPLDSDADSVPDFQDKCPGTPEGASVNAAGCWIAGVKFATDSAAIQDQYRSNLNEVLDLLRSSPGLHLEIQGHTDSVGSAEYNQQLSERRAQAVREYLVERGINPERLEAVGYGESQPTASNETGAGRAENRRVQLEPLD